MSVAVVENRRLFLLSGLGLFFGSFFLILYVILTFVPIGNARVLQFVSSSIIYLLVGICYPLALPGMHKKQASGAGMIGIFGLVIVIIAWLFSDLLILLELIFLQQIQTGKISTSLSTFFSLFPFIDTFVLLLPGNILLGAAIIRAGIFPKWTGIVFIVIAIIGLIIVLLPFSITISIIS